MPALARIATALLLSTFALASGGCSTNPATGQQSFTAFMSPAEEARVGAQEHPKILKEFGGAYCVAGKGPSPPPPPGATYECWQG